MRRLPSLALLKGFSWQFTTVAYTSDKTEPSLPIPHRFAIIYLSLPLALWLVGYFHWWVGVPLCALLVVSLWRCLAGPWEFRLLANLFPMLAISILFVALTPMSGLVVPFEGGDWAKHRSLLTDLVQSDWPAQTQVVGEQREEESAYLRYYLAFYLVPAFIAKPFGLPGLNWAVPLWTLLGWLLATLVFVHGRPRPVRHRHGTSGWACFALIDLPDVMAFLGSVASLFGANPSDTLDFWSLPMTEQRAITPHNHLSLLLRVSPQHSLGGVIAAAVVMRSQDNMQFHGVMAVVLTSLAWWSPYSAVGVMFLMVGIVASVGLRPALTWQNLLVAPLLAVPLAIFIMTRGDVSAQLNWSWEVSSTGTLIWLLPLFYASAILPWSVVLLAYFRSRRTLIMLGSVVTLFIALPIVRGRVALPAWKMN